MINEDEAKYINNLQMQLEAEQTRRMNTETINGQLSAANFPKDQNIIEYQLNLQEELDRIYHLLSGHVIKQDRDGNELWVEPDDDRLKIFSDYGVKQIMNIISFYINKNHLLSNYDEETIFWKVKDFGIELSDLIFNRYESFFYYPTPEELFEKYKPVMLKNGINITEKELYFKCVQWSKEELQAKLRHYPMIVLALVDSIHATLLRALNGEERESLRKQYNIHQSLSDSQFMPQQPKFSLIKPTTWTK